MKYAFGVKWTYKIRIHQQVSTIERASRIRQVLTVADK